MTNAQFLWPDGKRFALTSCWDDGTIHDRTLVAIFNRHGLKASFNLCSGKLGLSAEQSGWKEFIRADEVRSLYQGHEVCSHTVNHLRTWSLPAVQFQQEVLEDRGRLESLVGYPVRGFAIPYNWPTGQDWIRHHVQQCGFKYLRNTAQVPQFDHPSDFMDWHPTAHCSADLPGLWETMLQRGKDQPGQLFYFHGHSYEFEDSWGWEVIEAFARLAGSTESVHHATNGGIFDYVTAWRAMDWSLDGTVVRNNSALPLWFLRGGETICVEGGQMVSFKDG
jgi:hypothetical protein